MKYVREFLRHPKAGELAKHYRDLDDLTLNFAALRAALRCYSALSPINVVVVGDGELCPTGITLLLSTGWKIWSIDPKAKTLYTEFERFFPRPLRIERAIKIGALPRNPDLLVAVHSHAKLPAIGKKAVVIPCCVKQIRHGKCITYRDTGIKTKHKTVKIWMNPIPKK